MPRESTFHTFTVATALCVVCSVLVSGAAVGLRPKQVANKELDRQKNIIEAAGLQDPDKTVEQIFEERIESRLVNLETGEYVEDGDVEFEIATYDQIEASKKPGMSDVIASGDDIAGIGRREKYSFVYVVKDDGGAVEQVVLPVNGKGLWSTLYGFLALDADLKTIRGLTFYQHAETPGLGGEVDNPKWKGLWPGKMAFDDDGQIVIEVIKGIVGPTTPNPEWKVDGMSGATITTRGVSNLVRFWLGDNGFGPYFEKFSAGKGA